MPTRKERMYWVMASNQMFGRNMVEKFQEDLGFQRRRHWVLAKSKWRSLRC